MEHADAAAEKPEGYGKRFNSHGWTSPPRDKADPTRYAAGPRPPEMDARHAAAFDALAAAGTLNVAGLAGKLGVGETEACGLLAGLAGSGGLRDRSPIAEARAQKWREECWTIAGLAARGRSVASSLASAARHAGVRHPRLRILYMAAAGLLDSHSSRRAVAYSLPGCGADAPAPGEAAPAPPAVTPSPAEARVLALLAERPLTYSELHAAYGGNRSRIWDFETSMAVKGFIRRLDFMGEKFLCRSDMSDSDARFSLLRSGRVIDPLRIRTALAEELASGMPLDVRRACAVAQAPYRAVREVMDSMTATGEAAWDGKDVLVGPSTCMDRDMAASLPSRTLQFVLLAALKLGEFTSVEANRLVDAAGEPTPDRPNRCLELEQRYGYLVAANPGESRKWSGVARVYALTDKGRKLAEAISRLQAMSGISASMDAVLVEHAHAPAGPGL